MSGLSRDTEDGRLVELARAGDEEAFEILYCRHRDYVMRLAARFGATGQDALDVLQETFLYFFRTLPRFRLRARFTTFLYPTVKHLALKRTARLARFRPSDDLERAVQQPPDAADAETATRLSEIVLALPEGQREVVTLRFVDGMTIEEISIALGIPAGTVKSRLHHALVALRRENP